MTTKFFHQIRRDLTLSLEGFRETVLAVAERVTRRVQILTLRWHAAATLDQIRVLQQKTGEHVAALPQEDPAALDQRLADSARRIQALKRDLERTDGLISELDMEVLREDLLALQRDLAARAASMERLVLPKGAVSIGHTVAELSLPQAVRVAAVFRGPMLLLSFEHVRLRAGDIVLLLGHRDDLKEAAPRFLARRSATA